jgi:DNA-binding IclR family transcriptional regulator
MLRIAAAIADTGPHFTCQSLSEETGLAGSTVHRSLQQLAAADLVVRRPRVKGSRTQEYERRVHTFWDAARQIRRDALADTALSAHVETMKHDETEDS